MVVTYKPLKLEFYHDGVLETVLDGSRLIMENVNFNSLNVSRCTKYDFRLKTVKLSPS